MLIVFALTTMCDGFRLSGSAASRTVSRAHRLWQYRKRTLGLENQAVGFTVSFTTDYEPQEDILNLARTFGPLADVASVLQLSPNSVNEDAQDASVRLFANLSAGRLGGRIVKVLYALMLSSLFLLPNSVLAEDRTYTFAVVPQQAVTELAKNWMPFLALLSERSGVKMKFVTAPDIPTFEKRLGQGAYDFAYMNPYHYIVFHKKSGYQAFAKEKGRRITGILVTRNDSSITDIKDLNGLTLVFPAPAAFAASILPRAALRKDGVVFTEKFVASHESVYIDVAQGMYPAGGGIERTLELMDDATRKKLHVIWTTPGYTPHAIACHPRIPNKVERKLQEAMLSLNGDIIGQAALKGIGFKGIELAHDRDWNDVRQLKITELDSRPE